MLVKAVRHFRSGLILLSLGVCIAGYPDGAPLEACQSMTPRHGDHKSKEERGMDSASNYVFQVEHQRPQFSKLKVTLKAKTGTFKGFFIQIRDPEDFRDPVGLFPEDPSTYAVRHCPDSRGDEVFQSAVTHASNEARSSLEIQWNPPATSPLGTPFVVVATVVESFDTFHANITHPFKL